MERFREQLNNITPNKWQKLEVVYLTPEVRTQHDNLSVYGWLRGEESITIDDIKVEVFEHK